MLPLNNIDFPGRRSAVPFLIVWLLGVCGSAIATEALKLDLLHPQPYQVVQRQGFDPPRAHEHEPGGPVLGFALVPVEIDISEATLERESAFEYRVTPLDGAKSIVAEWSAAEGQRHERSWSTAVRIPAGGWYRLEVHSTTW